MKLRILKPCALSLLFVLAFHPAFSESTDNRTRQLPVEFRGVWVATVTNIDWPSKRTLSVEELKKEALNIIELHHKMGMNTIILQVRPSGDAIYPTNLAPWSVYLTGKQGNAPEGGFDPLKFWVDECKKRNIELHAWINPFRASLHSTDSLTENHPARLHPEWVVEYNGKLYFDPGIPEVRHHLTEVIRELVRNYDIAAIHIDDYFYPYPATGFIFKDSASYEARSEEERHLSIHDWRRSNTDKFIMEASAAIHAEKAYVKFGISPFGVWRNKSEDPRGSDTRAGVTSYDHLYADVVKWAHQGWIDYVIPQIYWSSRDKAANFLKLAQWWNDNITDRHLYIGHGIYKINGTQENWDDPNELKQQILFSRSLRNVKGSAFYSHNHFLRKNNNLNQLLEDSLYRDIAAVPPMEWLQNKARPEPVNNLKYKRGLITWEAPRGANTTGKPLRYVVYIANESGGEAEYITRSRVFKPESKTMPGRGRFTIQVAVMDADNSISEKSEVLKIRY